MALEVRRARLGDARALAEVHIRAWQAGYRGMMPDELLDGLSVTDRTARWRETLRDPAMDGAVLVAQRDEALLGFVVLATPSRDEDAADGVAEVGAINVHPDAWRSGIGAALMDAALSTLTERSWHTVTLWVLEANDRARAFYARYGFAADGAQTVHAPSGQAEIRLRRALPGEPSPEQRQAAAAIEARLQVDGDADVPQPQ